MFENYSKCRIFEFSILASLTNFCLIKSSLSGNNDWPSASSFQKLFKVITFGIFNQFLATQNVNVTRFARNVEWDFLCDFQTPWSWKLKDEATDQNPNFSSWLQKFIQEKGFSRLSTFLFSCLWTSRPSPSMSSLILDPQIGLRYDFLVYFPLHSRNSRISEKNDFFGYRVFENRPKSRIQYCEYERSELRLDLKWTKVH